MKRQKEIIDCDLLKNIGLELRKSLHPILLIFYILSPFSLLFIGSIWFFVAWWIKWGWGIENIYSGIAIALSTIGVIWTSRILIKKIIEDKKIKTEIETFDFKKSILLQDLKVQEGILKRNLTSEDSDGTRYLFLVNGQKEEKNCILYGKYKRNETFYIVSLKYVFRNDETRSITLAFNSNQYILDEKILGLHL